MKTTDWIQTYTGKKFYPLEPDADLICIEDIAHSLSMQCRYNGHTGSFYSVAEHSVILADEFCSSWHHKLVALLHDAAEAYLGDIPRPLKRLPKFAFYREAEDRLLHMILDKFCDFDWTNELKNAKQADALLLAQEAHVSSIVPAGCGGWDLVETFGYTPKGIKHLPPFAAEGIFLVRFEDLMIAQRDRSSVACRFD